ncbi:MAG: hypothetical protein R3C05_11515 [Pirellulaceae bacterium]
MIDFLRVREREIAGQQRGRTDARSADARAAQLFPMKPVEVVNHLLARSYACRAESLQLLVWTDGIEPADYDVWTRADDDAAAERFEECESFTPYATMCWAPGCR